VRKATSVCPNLGFIKQLQLYEKMNLNIRGNSLFHQQYQKLRLKSVLLHEKQRWTLNPQSSQLFAGKSEGPVSQLGFVCAKCKTLIASRSDVIEHDREQISIEFGEHSRGQTKQGDPEQSETACNSIMFVPSIERVFLGDTSREQGNISCKDCFCIVGRWNWNTFVCSCGAVSKPGFCLFSSTLEQYSEKT